MSRQITLSLNILRDLIFGFDELSDIRAESVTDAGPETYFPVIVPKELGKVLADLNTDDLFQIFHFANHSEVWHKKHWLDSNSRRWQMIARSAASTAAFTERQQQEANRRNKLDRIRTLIIAKMTAFNNPAMEATLTSMAIALSKMPEDQCEIVPGLKEILYGQTNQ